MTTTPHDAMFKAAFSKLRHARGLLRQLLPALVAQRFRWSTLRLESGIAVDDDDLDEQRMDLVYSVRAGRRRVLIYVLAEHQSKVDPWMVLRVLCYLVAIWKGFRAQHPRARKLPAIIPLVVHHSAARWTAPVAFEDVIDADAELLAALGAYIPRFQFLLDDLAVQSDAALRSRQKMTPGGRVAILSLKHGRAPIEVRIRVLSPDGRAPSARDVLAIILRYILETSGAQPAKLRGLLARQMGRKEAEEMLTTAEMLRREGRSEGQREGEARGRSEGKREGEAKGKREALLLLLRQRFGRLPAAAVGRVGKAGAAELDAWLGSVLSASSLDELLGAKARRKA